MQIHKDVTIVDLALQYKDHLIIGDLQLGYEEYLNEKGVLVPRFQTHDVLERIKTILGSCTGVKTIVFNGDIKHEFGRISRQEWQSVTKLIEELVQDYKIIMIKGNHDVMLAPIINKFKTKIKLVVSYVIDDILIIHGDKIHPAPQKTIIIAHEHPAISFPEKPHETYKCFLKGTWQRHTLIVMPSFSTLTIGTDITREQRLSPYLKKNLSQFDIYVIADTLYHFGKLGKLRMLNS